MEFTDHLKQALERQIENDIAREVLLLKLAVENANENCKKLLNSLPKDLVEITEACNTTSLSPAATSLHQTIADMQSTSPRSAGLDLAPQ